MYLQGHARDDQRDANSIENNNIYIEALRLQRGRFALRVWVDASLRFGHPQLRRRRDKIARKLMEERRRGTRQKGREGNKKASEKRT